ncbi:MAG: DUF1361 domain-containing protein [Liquorilactobacillus hordei]|uniref:Uncharacterized protein n=2 Tax=Liquorilactobacillus hordei TaxID=468911 RepID=A0A0R1MI43_9LACO|nr:DUF1361 domain-containing protein [Liquorilactobacillus hordei]AUJ30245.1 hypothetical protein BSQ49_08610 [Liquorilactobacillus hordei]KRL04083.1 hypothetical protein FC92_GL001793 [Liquorilactobacillus hordei DSM 19519]QYH52857.1 DUF1361 domain-containing protein [Liquorilactobacillus hordei DSM 19519]
MSTTNKWIVRLSFYIFLLYIYITVASHNRIYSFLLLNTFLGYIPIEIAMHINSQKKTPVLVVLTVLWFLFYPNAPYVITDLFHLAMLNPYNSSTGLMEFNLHLWLKFTNLVTSALGCSLMGFWSLEHVADTILIKFKLWSKTNKIFLVSTLIIFSSVGIYIGRFLRLHTAYLFIDPKEVVSELIQMWNPRMLVFIGFMTIIQLIFYFSFDITRSSLSNNQELLAQNNKQKEQ